MGRSPSPPRRRDDRVRDRERERSRDRERNRDRERRRPRSRERERVRSRSRERPQGDRRRRSGDRRRRSRSDSGDRSSGPSKPPRRLSVHERPAITAADLEGKSPEEREMIQTMGFGGFDTTKGRNLLLNHELDFICPDDYD